MESQADRDWILQERKRRIVGFIGGYLLEDGALTTSDLDRGLEAQLRLAAQGRQVQLGQLLVEMGFITREQLEHALARQAKDEASGPGASEGSVPNPP